ncbi:MAG TPA: DUF1343 domain-containing protein [Gemmataceae bacterium]
MTAPRVGTGLACLAADNCARFRGQRVGLVVHPASVDARLRHAVELFASADGVELTSVFGPEHGLLGEAQDLIGVGDDRDPLSGVRAVSLYSSTVDSLRPAPDQLADLDVLVIDLQDVGSRYYTFPTTMLYCLEAAAGAGLRVVVLDRPNPIGGGAVEGPTLRPGFESFVGAHPIAIRHGLTVGELARLYRAERRIDVELDVVACDGWRRDMGWDATGLPWVLPSPNMPTPDTAFVYPGQCLIEGTNLSEGRGTTRPFELCGAPGIDARAVCRRLNGANLPGVVFRPAWFQPTFQKHAGKRCGGMQLHVTDRMAFGPVRTGLAVLAALREAAGNSFAWRTEEYEFVRDPIAIDLLFGSDRERRALEAGHDWREIATSWEAEEGEFNERRRAFLMY